MGTFANFAPGQYSTFFADILQPTSYGRFHFAGDVASHHNGGAAEALDITVRVVNEVIRLVFRSWDREFREKYGVSAVFRDEAEFSLPEQK